MNRSQFFDIYARSIIRIGRAFFDSEADIYTILYLIAAAVNPFSFAEAAGRHSFRECPDPGAQSFRRRICKHSVGKLDIAAFLRKNDQGSEGFGLSF